MLYIRTIPCSNYAYQLWHEDPRSKIQRRICDALVDVPTAYMSLRAIYDLFDAPVHNSSLLLRFGGMSTTYIKHEGERNWYKRRDEQTKQPLTLGEFCEMFCRAGSFVIDWTREDGE